MRGSGGVASGMVIEEIAVPAGIELRISGNTIEVAGPKGRLTRTFDMPGIELGRSDDKVTIVARSRRRAHRAAVGTAKAHLRNMFKGVKEGFTYKLRIVYSHFPITVKVDGKRVLIHNFLGERTPRVAKIAGDVNVRVEGDEVIVEGINKDEVGQTAFNIEQATFIKRRDPRVFQDGIYIVERA